MQKAAAAGPAVTFPPPRGDEKVDGQRIAVEGERGGDGGEGDTR